MHQTMCINSSQQLAVIGEQSFSQVIKSFELIMRTKIEKKFRLNTGNTTVHSGTNILGLYRPKFHSYLYLYVSPALGYC